MPFGSHGASCCVGKSKIGSLGGKLKSFTDWRKFEGRGPVADPCVNQFVMFEFTDVLVVIRVYFSPGSSCVSFTMLPHFNGLQTFF